MSKKEFSENLKKLDKSELKSVDGGYNIAVTTAGIFLSGTLRNGDGYFSARFDSVQSAFMFAEANLLKEGEVLVVQAAPNLGSLQPI